ncbi:MAG: TIGR04551 family protein [Kofleriaceae bacterium]
MTARAAVITAFALTSSLAYANPSELADEPTERSLSGLFEIVGNLRVRSEALYNFDLDHDLTPAGTPLYLVPPSGGQTLTHADMRLRTDLAVYAPTKYLAIRARIDLFDGVALGSKPIGVSATTLSQEPPDSFLIRRAYGEARTAIGVIAAGRIGSHWGMGLFTNGGDCADCNFGDSADSLQFITSIGGHAWTLAYDLAATGPAGTRADGRGVDLDRDDDARTLRFSVLRSWGPDGIARRLKANTTSVEYGAYYAHRSQDRDSVAVPGASGGTFVQVPRGLSAHVIDGWFRMTAPWLIVEAEAAVIRAQIDQFSSIPGVLVPMPVKSSQLGAAVRTEVGGDGVIGGGLDAGYASGDSAPGFGAFPRSLTLAQPGDLDGLQANGITDASANNFRFHPDFRIDRILFHEIIGTVTDALYVRPHVHYRTRALGAGVFTAEVAAIASMAVEANSTPSGEAPLGIEIDPTVKFASNDGFTIALEHAVLLPLSGLDNAVKGISAKPAQSVRLFLGYAF